ncbi:hypothetical protein F3Y22_tig00005246pilonHSYRG00003 [Hibiscus syriacus]|uniref:Uncharacterized protein n=1 Tax=Hibiscus syriacus TaxID=106335 RepID=A0A6A3CGM4_HIBSY|nr:hypothetical protein F3Y22_tig00005246pilonHSYRG00003 [Hibiscus syriacus]
MPCRLFQASSGSTRRRLLRHFHLPGHLISRFLSSVGLHWQFLLGLGLGLEQHHWQNTTCAWRLISASSSRFFFKSFSWGESEGTDKVDFFIKAYSIRESILWWYTKGSQIFSNLRYLDLSVNRLSQSISETIGDMLKLFYLNLSINNFNQRITAQIGELVQLTDLDLSYNMFSGQIPTQFQYLQSLSTLNLSYNDLSGSITIFNVLRGLIYVDIAHNELQGPIPDVPAFQNASIQALEGNKGLCGNISDLKPCNPSKKGHYKLLYAIIFPLLGAVILSISILASFFSFERWRKDAVEESEISMNDVNLFTISSFNKKLLL